MNSVLAVCGILAVAVCGGCCPQRTNEVLNTRVMPPLPASEQIARINERAGIVETIRAKGRVAIAWIDKDGKQHQEAADGTLLFRKKSVTVDGSREPVVYYEAVLFGRVRGAGCL